MKRFIAGVLIGLCYCAFGMVAQWPSRVDFRAALLDAIAAAGLNAQTIYTALGYTQGQWSKIVNGEPGHRLPNLDRLEDLPPAVWDHLFPRLAYVVWQRRQQEQQQQRSA